VLPYFLNKLDCLIYLMDGLIDCLVTGLGKLLERSQKIAYNLHKVGSKADPAVKPGDRVSDILPNPVNYC